MPLIQEDGTGLPTANSYASVADFKAYHKDRGNALPDGTSSGLISQALVRTTDYLDRRFRFKGRRKEIDRSAGTAQRLEWPRINVVDRSGYQLPSDEVPREILEAVYEYAIRELSSELNPDTIYDERNVAVTATSTTIGPITESVEYADGGVPYDFRQYPEIDATLRGLIIPNGRAVR